MFIGADIILMKRKIENVNLFLFTKLIFIIKWRKKSFVAAFASRLELILIDFPMGAFEAYMCRQAQKGIRNLELKSYLHVSELQ